MWKRVSFVVEESESSWLPATLWSLGSNSHGGALAGERVLVAEARKETSKEVKRSGGKEAQSTYISGEGERERSRDVEGGGGDSGRKKR